MPRASHHMIARLHAVKHDVFQPFQIFQDLQKKFDVNIGLVSNKYANKFNLPNGLLELHGFNAVYIFQIFNFKLTQKITYNELLYVVRHVLLKVAILLSLTLYGRAAFV